MWVSANDLLAGASNSVPMSPEIGGHITEIVEWAHCERNKKILCLCCLAHANFRAQRYQIISITRKKEAAELHRLEKRLKAKSASTYEPDA